MADISPSDNMIESLLEHIADNSRVSAEQFEDVVAKLNELVKTNEAFADNMEDALREAIDAQLKSARVMSAFTSGDNEKTKGVSKAGVESLIKDSLKEILSKNPELFKTSGDNEVVKAIEELRDELREKKTDVGSLIGTMFGPTRQGKDQEKEKDKNFKNLFNLFKKPNSDDEDRKANKHLEGIKLFFSSRAFMGKLGATILGAIMDSKFLKGGLKDLLMVGLLLVSSWIRKHFGPVAAGVAFFAPAILGILGKILLTLGTFKLFRGAAGLVGGLLGLLGGGKVAGLAGKGIVKLLGKEGTTALIKGGAKVIGGAAKSAGMGKNVTKVIGSTAGKMIASLGKEGTKKVVTRAATKVGTKAVAGTAAKVLGKKIPGVGAIIGTGLAAGRLMKGDLLGAGLEFASGMASTVPGLGTAASLALDAGIIARDAGAFKGASKVMASESKLGTKANGLGKWGWALGLLVPALIPLLGGLKGFTNGTSTKEESPTNKLNITNTLLASILTVLKHKTNFGQFGFSDTPTDIEGKPIGAWDRFKNWIGGFSSGDSGVVPTGTPNTYSSGGSSFGGHSITGSYLEGRKGYSHHGLDLSYKRGDAVGAKVAGTVKYAGVHTGTGGAHSYGGLVIVTDKNGADHYYAHLSKIIAKKGQQVDQGTIIGLAGSTGTSSGNHLHYEVREGAGKGAFTGEATDPMKYARSMGYDEKAEKAVFQSEEDYNKGYTSTVKDKSKGNTSKKSNITFKNMCDSSEAKNYADGKTIHN